jgi:hypothetical protein
MDAEDASYIELAEFIATYGEADHITRDLQELFTRVVFNVATATAMITCGIMDSSGLPQDGVWPQPLTCPPRSEKTSTFYRWTSTIANPT